MGDRVTAPVSLVCFDWGGVLLRICRSLQEGVRAAGLDIRPVPEDPDLYYVRRGASLAFQKGEIGEAEFFEETRRSLRGVYSVDEIALVHDAWLLGEYPGVDRLVNDLHATGVATGVLSNTNARHWARRERDFPTCGRMRHGHASHLLGLAKPDPAIYTAFAETTGMDGREREILFFDDLPENIDAAQAAGWRGVVVDHTGDTARQMRAELQASGVLAG
ncbi:MAG: HAD-IA family hydrolase [Planctomycetota bacterium]